MRSFWQDTEHCLLAGTLGTQSGRIFEEGIRLLFSSRATLRKCYWPVSTEAGYPRWPLIVGPTVKSCLRFERMPIQWRVAWSENAIAFSPYFTLGDRNRQTDEITLNSPRFLTSGNNY
jgi:hypothetical protein